MLPIWPPANSSSELPLTATKPSIAPVGSSTPAVVLPTSSVVVVATLPLFETSISPVLVKPAPVASVAPSSSERLPALLARAPTALLLVVAPASAMNALVPSIDSEPLEPMLPICRL